jgi:Haem-NO-binding
MKQQDASVEICRPTARLVVKVKKGFSGMKGVVFTTFYTHCEDRFGVEMLDDIIQDADLPNKGAYTSVGSYPFQEMVALITALVRRTGQSMPTILDDFGHTCFAKWVSYVPSHFENKSLFDILEGVDHFHETEVRKLYPDAELPSFKVESRDERTLVLGYFSCKPLADLAAGVIRGAADHLGEKITIKHRPVVDGMGAHVRFEVRRIH